MTVYLDLDAAVSIAARAISSEPQIADYGLLESTLARPRASVVGLLVDAPDDDDLVIAIADWTLSDVRGIDARLQR